jgi:hypothetical protein
VPPASVSGRALTARIGGSLHAVFSMALRRKAAGPCRGQRSAERLSTQNHAGGADAEGEGQYGGRQETAGSCRWLMVPRPGVPYDSRAEGEGRRQTSALSMYILPYFLGFQSSLRAPPMTCAERVRSGPQASAARHPAVPSAEMGTHPVGVLALTRAEADLKRHNARGGDPDGSGCIMRCGGFPSPPARDRCWGPD